MNKGIADLTCERLSPKRGVEAEDTPGRANVLVSPELFISVTLFWILPDVAGSEKLIP